MTSPRLRSLLALGAAFGLTGALALEWHGRSAAGLVKEPGGADAADDLPQEVAESPDPPPSDRPQETRLQGAGLALRPLDPPGIVLQSDEDLVRIRVLDDQGRPVPGADVHWIGGPSGDPFAHESFVRDRIVHTNAEGRAALHIDRFEQRRIVVQARDHDSVTVAPSLFGPVVSDLLVVLGQGPVIEGRVVAEEDGRPLAGARVYKVDPVHRVPLAEATTGADGRFRLRAGRFRIRVPLFSEDPLWVVTVHGPDGDWNYTTPFTSKGPQNDLTLVGFGAIEGRVLAFGGAPAASVRVRGEYVIKTPEWLNPDRPTNVPPTDLAPMVVTSADGSFRFPRLLGMPVRIWAEGADGRMSEPVSTQPSSNTAVVLEPIVLPSGE